MQLHSARLLFRHGNKKRKIASDTTRKFEKCLEAYKNIIDSEIGDANMTRARNMKRSRAETISEVRW